MSEPLQTTHSIGETATSYAIAADALSRLDQIKDWGVAGYPSPSELTFGWHCNKAGYQVIRGELQKIIEERWADLLKVAVGRIGERAREAVGNIKSYGKP